VTLPIQSLTESLANVHALLQAALPASPEVFGHIMMGVHSAFLSQLLSSLRVSQFGSILLARDTDALLNLCSPEMPEALAAWSRLRLVIAVFIPPADALLPVIREVSGGSQEGEEEVMKLVERRSDWRSGLGRSKWANEMVREMRGGGGGGMMMARKWITA
jgi:hypothetical protein